MINNLIPECLPPNVFIGGINQGKAQTLLSQFLTTKSFCNLFSPSPVIARQSRSNLYYLFCLLLTAYCLLLFVGCSSAPKKTAQVQLIESGLYRNISEGELIDPLKKADVFYTSDTQAVIWTKLHNIEGSHTMRWE